MTLIFGSLFSGIGGIDLGLERAGMECRWQVEIDPYCQAVLSRHWPDIPKYGDVRELSGSTLEAVDAICGGFPCQPVSLAGRRQGEGDSRWLWPEYARLVDEIRPRYVIVENVPGIYSLGGPEIAADLAAMGYDAEWGSLSAETFNAPHKRERFVLVAHSGSQRRQQDSRSTHGNEGEDAWGGAQNDYLSERNGQSHRAKQVSGTLANPNRQSAFRTSVAWAKRHPWASEPDVGRVANGIPYRVDRIRSLGNSVVPNVFEFVGQQVIEDAMRRGYL